MMSGLSKLKIAVYLAAIFCAGAVSGWVVAAKTAKENLFKPPRPSEIAGFMRHRLHSNLDLTPEQTKQIDAIIEGSSAELRALHEEGTKRVRQAISNRNAQIVAILTPEQQKRFEEMEKERRESWRKRDSSRGKDRERDRWRGSRDREREGTNGQQTSPTNRVR